MAAPPCTSSPLLLPAAWQQLLRVLLQRGLPLHVLHRLGKLNQPRDSELGTLTQPRDAELGTLNHPSLHQPRDLSSPKPGPSTPGPGAWNLGPSNPLNAESPTPTNAVNSSSIKAPAAALSAPGHRPPAATAAHDSWPAETAASPFANPGQPSASDRGPTDGFGSFDVVDSTNPFLVGPGSASGAVTADATAGMPQSDPTNPFLSSQDGWDGVADPTNPFASPGDPTNPFASPVSERPVPAATPAPQPAADVMSDSFREAAQREEALKDVEVDIWLRLPRAAQVAWESVLCRRCEIKQMDQGLYNPWTRLYISEPCCLRNFFAEFLLPCTALSQDSILTVYRGRDQFRA